MSAIIVKASEKSTKKEISYEMMSKILASNLSIIKYNEITKDYNYCLRKRKFNLYTYIVICIMLYYNNERNITLDLVCAIYNKETGMNITPQAISKQLKKDETKRAVQKFTNTLLSESVNMGIQDTYIKNLLDLLYQKVGITSILGTDGTCLNVMPGCRETMGASTMGHLREDGTAEKACIKAHISQNITNDIVSATITGTAGKGVGERAQVHPEDYKNMLVLADAGYQSSNLISDFDNNSASFIIKSKSNIIGTIINVNSVIYNNEPVNLRTNILKNASPRINEIIDVDVKLSDGTMVRVIKYAFNANASRRNNNKKTNKKKKKVVVILTNIKSENIKSETIINLYRLRWRICEIGNKCMKGGNYFKPITSHNSNIVSEFICFSLIAFTIKNIEAKIMTKICKEKNLFTKELKTKIISPLKMHKKSHHLMSQITRYLFYNYDKFLKGILDLTINKYKYFTLTAPSKKDKENMRNVYCIIDKIMKTEGMAA